MAVEERESEEWMPEAVVVDSEEKLKTSVAQHLKGVKVLAVDCEGQDMGMSGTLEMVQVSTPDAVLLIDVQATGKPALSSLLGPVLRDESTEVLMWDCRKDCLVLKYFAGIEVTAILDLQLADVLMNEPYHKFHTIIRKRGTIPHMERGFRALRGLKKAFAVYSGKDDKLGAMEACKAGVAICDVDWSKRPYDDDVLKYALADVYGLHLLARYLLPDRGVRTEVAAASARYAALLLEPSATLEATEYICSFLLPIGILVPTPTRHASACKACARRLPPACFLNPHCSKCANFCPVCQEVYHRRLAKDREQRVKEGKDKGKDRGKGTSKKHSAKASRFCPR